MYSASWSRRFDPSRRTVAPYLPAGSAARERLATSLTDFAREEMVRRDRPGWRDYVPVLRPRERALDARADRAVDVIFPALRRALVDHAHDADAQTADAHVALVHLGRFYAALGTYDGDAANRRLLRTFALSGLPFFAFSLFGTGVYLAEYPELCGAAPAIVGAHLGHVLEAVGAAAFVIPMGAALSKSGSAWMINLGTPAADRTAGIRRVEARFWTQLARRWTADPAMPRLGDAPDPAARVLPAFEHLRKPLSAACERWLGKWKNEDADQRPPQTNSSADSPAAKS